jgi:ankyrin
MVVRNSFSARNRGSKKVPDRNRFFAAVKWGHDSVVKEFLDTYDDALTWRHQGRTPLMIAARNNHYSVVHTLLHHGAPPGEPGVRTGRRPLHEAAESDNARIAGLLLHFGARADLAAHDGATPLMLAACNPGAKAAALLLRHGASVTKQDAEGKTPLHFAAAAGQEETARLLLDSKAPIDAARNDGRTPLMTAAEGRWPVVAALLLERGADYHLRDKGGASALDLAAAQREDDPEFAEAFAMLVDAHNRANAPKIAQPFTEGSEKQVRVGRPLKLRRTGTPSP